MAVAAPRRLTGGFFPKEPLFVSKDELKLASDLFECSEDDLGTSTGCRLEALTGARVNGPNFRGNLEALEQSVGSNRFWPEPGWL